MSIIHTNYRDLPFDAIKGCLTPEGLKDQDPWKWEVAGRGRPVAIRTPACEISDPEGLFRCKGPFFEIVQPRSGRRFTDQGHEIVRVVCPHIAEIGD